MHQISSDGRSTTALLSCGVFAEQLGSKRALTFKDKLYMSNENQLSLQNLKFRIYLIYSNGGTLIAFCPGFSRPHLSSIMHSYIVGL